jgi:alpha-1,2-glucosyltransferase
LDGYTCRVLLSPIYGVLTYLSLHRLCRSRGALWLLIYLVAVTISLAPTPLLELRYFTPAVMLAMLHSPEVGAVELLFYYLFVWFIYLMLKTSGI